MGDVKRVEYKGKILAIVISSEIFNSMTSEGKEINFATPDEFPLQVGMHSWKPGKIIKKHFHLPFAELKDFPVQEYFYVVSGKVKINLYDDRENDAKVSEVIVKEGDQIILNTGHGMESLEPSRIIELKQGPYRGQDLEKRYFP
jgi:mannose-6-phosphate isomerase-like protein (cupin superfamily)